MIFEYKLYSIKNKDHNKDDLEPLITDFDRAVKMDVDHSATCNEQIAVVEALAAKGKLQKAMDTLVMLEKQTRTVSHFFFLYYYNYTFEHIMYCY